MRRTTEVTLAFAGEERTFRLPLGRLRALQEKCNAGPSVLSARLANGEWLVDDIRETYLQGLIGGGMDQPTATKLILTHMDDEPLGQFVLGAYAIVSAVIVGVEDEPLGEVPGEGDSPTPSPTENFASPKSTEPEPSSDIRPEK